MKFVYKPLLNIATKLLVCLSLLIGFSCATETGETDSLSTPTSVYIIDGRVVNENNAENAIAGLQIEIIFDKPQSHKDTIYSGDNGRFQWEGLVSTFGKNITFNIAVTDTNEVYESRTIPVSFRKEDSETDTSWLLGVARKSILIRLKEKTKNN